MNKSILIVGASTGIGRDCVEHLHAQGYKVLATVRTAGDAPACAQEIILDVTGNLAPISNLDFDAVVFNAGVVVAGPFEKIPKREFDHVIDVNFNGAVNVARLVIPQLRKRNGRLIFVSSISGRVATPMLSAYNASKFALSGLSDCLHRELRPHGVHVTSIEPGAIRTPIWKKSLSASQKVFSEIDISPYEDQLTAVEDDSTRAAQRAISPREVSHEIFRALTCRRPPAQILVGRDARFAGFLQRYFPGVLNRFLSRSPRRRAVVQ